jgi:hypothetical protein
MNKFEKNASFQVNELFKPSPSKKGKSENPESIILYKWLSLY